MCYMIAWLKSCVRWIRRAFNEMKMRQTQLRLTELADHGRRELENYIQMCESTPVLDPDVFDACMAEVLLRETEKEGSSSPGSATFSLCCLLHFYWRSTILQATFLDWGENGHKYAEFNEQKYLELAEAAKQSRALNSGPHFARLVNVLARVKGGRNMKTPEDLLPVLEECRRAVDKEWNSGGQGVFHFKVATKND